MARISPLDLAIDQGRPFTPDAWADSPFAIRGMTVAYGEKPAVFSLDLTVPSGAMAAIQIGGCGS